jgi:hypothetical protein
MRKMTESKYAIILIICFLLSNSLLSQTEICLEKIKTGKFVYYHPDGDSTLIGRTKSKQFEYKDFGKKKSFISKIEWVSDNEYNSIVIKKPSGGCLAKGMVINIKIFNCDQEKYEIEVSSKKCGGAILPIYFYNSLGRSDFVKPILTK